MHLDKIHHIAIIGSDYKKSKHFYQDILGFEVIRENYREDRDDYKIDMVSGDIEIELFIMKNCPSRPTYPEAYGLRHLAFHVNNIEMYIEELKAHGVEVLPLRYDDYTQKKMTFFFDPDGLPLELHE